MSADPGSARGTSGRHGWRSALRQLALFAALWWVLTGGAPESWLLGVPAVLLATWLCQSLWSARGLSFAGVAAFVPWFLLQSVLGAADVAFRAMQPRMPLHPGVVRCRLRLPAGPPRVALANVVSMLAGTLSADLEDDELLIHALDARKDLQAMVADIEPRIAAVFGLRLAPERGR